jgi:PBSX family phage terminase large subunit
MIGEKQKKILAFPYSKYDALICDGAIRTGKTSIMMVAFVDWAMREFSGCKFGICGKTINSAKQNIVNPYRMMTYPTLDRGYSIKWSGGTNTLEVTKGNVTNLFEVFGGKDESSFMLVQGRTLAGVLLDEVALMPQSFVNQVLARCSVEGSRYWFSCNPGSPEHWFYRDWVSRSREQNALRLHFELKDNPSLSPSIIERYERQYSGVFYDRYIKGLWTQAEGLIYPDYKNAVEKPQELVYKAYCVSLDYGTLNAFAALKWGLDEDGTWHLVDEYYYSGRDEMVTKTDADYLADMVTFTSDVPGTCEIIVDPSAASFIAALRGCKEREFRVRKASNDVLGGIQHTAVAMQRGAIKISSVCTHTLDEFAGYIWDDKASEDKPVKLNDHAMDALRYFVETKQVYRSKSDYKSVFGG